MNRRGELDKARAAARLGKSLNAMVSELIRHVDNDTGVIKDGMYTPKLTTLFRAAKLKRSAGFKALNHAIMHGWFDRHVTADPNKVAGVVKVGADCDCREATAVCGRPGCGKLLTGMRADARYCSDRCSKADRRRIARTTPQPSQSTEPGQPVHRARTCPTSEAGQLVHAARTNPRSGHLETASRPLENVYVRDRTEGERADSTEVLTEERPTNDLVQCQFCHEYGGGDLGVIMHAADCWAGAMWTLYEAER